VSIDQRHDRMTFAFISIGVLVLLAPASAAHAQKAGGKPIGNAPDEDAAGDLAGGVVPKGKVTTAIEPKPISIPRGVRFQRIGREQGLPQISVVSLTQDQRGFMWIGTGEGVVRYDGHRSRVFRHDPKDPNSLSASAVTRILVSKDGTLWVGTQNGLNRYDPGRSAFVRYMAGKGPDALGSNVVLALSEAPDGKLWIGTSGGGVSELDPATGKFRTYTGSDRTVVPAVVADKDGVVWLGTSEGLYRFVPSKQEFEPLFEEQQAVVITALLLDRSGTLWIGTKEQGLHRYSAKEKKLSSFAADTDPQTLADNEVRSIFEDRDGQLWVGTASALHRAVAGGKFERILPDLEDPRSLPRPPVEAIFQDKAGAIWVGTFGGGAGVLDPLALRFTFYRDLNGGLYEHGDDLWMATSDGVCRLRGQTTLTGVCYALGWSPRIFVDRRGSVWVTDAAQGIYRLDPGDKKNWTYYNHDPDDPTSINPGLAGAFEDRAGNIWVAAFGGGLQRYDRKGDRFVTEFRPPSNEIYVVQEDARQDGVYWLGTASQGLLRIDSGGQVQAFTPHPDDPDDKTDNAVVAMVFEDERTVWLATYGGGLKRLDLTSGRFKSYRVPDGLPSDSLYSLERDRKGYLWMSTVSGLARFDPKKEQFAVFSEQDGLQSDEFFLASSLATKDGRFMFGGVNGLTVFKPEEIDIDRYSPPVVITGISVLGEPYDGGRPAEDIGSLSLGYKDNQITFDLAALSYSGAGRTTFEYMVEGLNDRWFRLQAPSLPINGLDDGDYTLHLRARNRHGVVSKPITIGLAIAPPFWRTWWAYSIYGLCFLAVLFGVYRYQQGRIERVQKLSRLAAVEREFDLTATVQSWFLPENRVHTTGRSDLFGFYRAADKCGGDWWSFERVGKDRLTVIVGDVTGHGVAPAMLTAAIAMGLGVQSNGAISEDDLIDRLQRINTEVLSRCKGQQHMTMTALLLDEQSGHAEVFGLGGLPAVIIDQAGAHRVIAPRGVPLGSIDTLNVGRQAARLGVGDRLILTTDGVVEAYLANGRQLGFRRFVRLINDTRSLPIQQATEQIVREIDRARGNQTQQDDFTFCIVERRS